MRKLAIGITSLIALVVSLLVPAAPATSNGSDVTKTFSITKSDGTNYSGVLVALLEYDEELNEVIVSETATTVDGVATLEVPTDKDYFGWVAQPGTGDVTHALFTGYSISNGVDESFSARLGLANAVVNILQSAGSSAAEIGTSISYISTQDGVESSYKTIIRTGAFGIDFSSALQTGRNYEIAIEPNAMPSQYGVQLGLRVNTATDPVSRTFFTDTNYDTQISPVSGVHLLRLSGPNFSGELRNSSGGSLSLPSGVRVFAQAYEAREDGSPNFSQPASGSAALDSSGAFDLKIFTPSAGKYFVKFSSSGSLSIPSHLGSAFWVDGSGDYAMSQSGATFQDSDTFVYTSNIPPSSNLKIIATQPGGSPAERTYISVGQESSEGGNPTWWGGWTTAQDGAASFQLSDGAYQIYLDPQGSTLVRSQYELIIDAGEAFITDQSGDVVSAESDGVFRLEMQTPNLEVRVLSPTSTNPAIRSANIDIFTLAEYGDPYVTSGYVNNGSGALRVANGEYRLVVNPFVGSFAPKEYELVVTSSGITITDPSTDTEVSKTVGGAFILYVNTPNVTGVVLEPGSPDTPFASGNQRWANVNIEKQDGLDWRHHENVQVKSDGSFAAYLEDNGAYRVTVRVDGAPDAVNTTFTPTPFLTFNAQTGINLGNLKLNSPTFKVRVRQASSNVDLQNANVALTDNEGFYEHAQTGSLAVAGIGISAAGTYDLRVQPPYEMSSAVAAQKVYTLTATDKAGGGFNVSIADSAGTPISPVDGVYVLSLAIPNVTGKIFDSAGGSFNGQAGDYAWVQAERYDESRGAWEWTNYTADVFEDGSFGLSISENGRYRLKIDPYGLPDTSATRTTEFTVTDANRNATAKAYGDLILSAPTAKFRVRPAGSNTDLKFTGIEVHKDGEWVDWLNVGNDGLASFTSIGDGAYQFTAMPNDKAENSTKKTYSGTVSSGVLTMTGLTAQAGAFVLELGTPNVTGRLLDSDGDAVANTNNSWVWVQVQKYIPEEDRWNWTNNSANIRSDGSFALNVSEVGTYRLRIESSGRSDIALTYSETFSITNANASTFSRSFGSITLNTPTLSGTVLGIDESAKTNAQVVAINSATGEEMWEQSTWTDNAGKWGMLLPAGSYSLVARPGWRDSTNGASEELTGITVNSNGQVTSGPGSTPVTLRLTTPTWSGTVVSPSDATDLISDASVCLFTIVGQRGASSCAQTDAQGRWSLSKPSGFTGFNSQSTLTITENGQKRFADKRLSGVTDIETALGEYEEGDTFPGRTLSLAAPNAELTIVAGVGNLPVANTWVSFQRAGQWLGGSVTDNEGKVRFNVPDIASGFSVEAQPNSGIAANYTSTRKTFSASDVTSGTSSGTFRNTVSLATPNFKGTVREPGGGSPVRHTWVELYNQSLEEWVGGGGTNALGQFSLKLDPPSSGAHTFRITAHPSWSNTGALLSKQVYFAELSSTGDLTLRKGTSTGAVVSIEDGEYPLELKSPTATGTVTLPDGSTPVRDSWVVPIDVNQNRNQLWEMSQNSRGDGSFGLALEDGTYQVFANVPGELSNFARSALCNFQVSGSVITTANSDCVTDGELKLKLRNPNLTFKLMDGSSAVANAHVGVSVGNWYGWAQSSQDGTVSLLIDEPEIAASNPDWTSGSLPVTIDVNAPYGNTSVVSWRCTSGENKDICRSISGVTKGQTYLGTALSLGQIQFQKPNTTIIVRKSDGAVVENAWVALYREEVSGSNTWKRYMGSSSTDATGKAVFNVEDTSGTFTVELHTPWNLRSTQARKSYTGLAYSSLVIGTEFKLGAPNLTLTIKQSLDNGVSSWSNAWVEEVHPSTYVSERWVDGYGADETGVVPIFLEWDNTYRVHVNPGPGSTGTRTSCVVSVDSNGVVSKVNGQCSTGGSITSGAMDITLSSGNVFGKVRLDNGTGPAAFGAIVFAEAFTGGQAVSGLTRESIVGAQGDYGLQLETGYTWKIKVFYVNPTTSGTQYASMTTAFEIASADVPTGESRRETDFVLVAR